MDPMVIEFLGVLLRWALTSVGGYLVAHHILTAEQSEQFSSAFAHNAILALPAVAALALGLWSKYKGRIKFLTALSIHQPATENDVNAKISRGDATPSVLTPPNTVPGVPK